MPNEPRPMPEIPEQEPRSPHRRPVREPGGGAPAIEEPRQPRPAGARALMLALGVAALVSTALARPALAQECLDEVERVERQFDITSRPLPAAPSSPTDRQAAKPWAFSDKLAESGGVLRPSEKGAAMVIEPRSDMSAMQTAPRMPPQSSSQRDSGSSDATSALASDRLRLDSLLQAARAAAERGDNAACLDRLDKAKGLGTAGRG